MDAGKKLFVVLLFFVVSFAIAKTYDKDYAPSSGDAVEFDLMKEFDIIASVLRRNISGADNITDGEIKTADYADLCVTDTKFDDPVGPEYFKTNASGYTLKKLMQRVPGLGLYDETFHDIGHTWDNSCWLSRVDDDTIRVSSGGDQIMQRYRYQSTDQTDDPPTQGADEWTDVFITAPDSVTTWSIEYDHDVSYPGNGTPTSAKAKLIGSFYWDANQDIQMVVNFRNQYIIGWGYKVGDDSVDINYQLGMGTYIFFDIGENLGYYDPPVTIATYLGEHNAVPADITDFTAQNTFATVAAYANGDLGTTLQVALQAETGATFSSSKYYGFSWIMRGRYD